VNLLSARLRAWYNLIQILVKVRGFGSTGEPSVNIAIPNNEVLISIIEREFKSNNYH
jgi:hypothetical protein